MPNNQVDEASVPEMEDDVIDPAAVDSGQADDGDEILEADAPEEDLDDEPADAVIPSDEMGSVVQAIEAGSNEPVDVPSEKPKRARASRGRRAKAPEAAAEVQAEPVVEAVDAAVEEALAEAEAADADQPAAEAEGEAEDKAESESAEDNHASSEAAPRTPRSNARNRRLRLTERERNDLNADAPVWRALRSALQSNTVLEGKVITVERESAPLPGTNLMVPIAMLKVSVSGMFNVRNSLESGSVSPPTADEQTSVIIKSALQRMPFIVSIPFATEFYSTTPLNLQDLDLHTSEGRAQYFRSQEQMARKLLGRTVAFCLVDLYQDIDEETGKFVYSLLGSRKRALPYITRRVFEPRTGEPAVKQGDVVDTTTLSVGHHALQVTTAGVDVIVPNRLLTFQFIPDLRQVFKRNDVTRMKVTSITKDENGMYRLTLSGREVELDYAKEYGPKLLTPNKSVIRGQFTEIRMRNNAQCTAVAWLMDVRMPAVVRYFSPAILGNAPMSGDEAIFQVMGFSDSGMVIVRCVSLLDTPATGVQR